MAAIINTITNYAFGVLLVLTIVLGFTTYIYHGDKVRLQGEVVELSEQLRRSEANLVLVKKSCAIEQEVVNDVTTEIDKKQTVMTKTLEALITVPFTEEHSNDSKYADDANLSPEFMLLLDKAYCNAVNSDPYCTPSSASKDMSGGKSTGK